MPAVKTKGCMQGSIGWAVQALESAVRKKKQIVLSEDELRQQHSRAQSPEKPTLLQRMLLTVRRGGGVQALEQNIATLREEVLFLQAPCHLTCRRRWRHGALNRFTNSSRDITTLHVGVVAP